MKTKKVWEGVNILKFRISATRKYIFLVVLRISRNDNCAKINSNVSFEWFCMCKKTYLFVPDAPFMVLTLRL